ncbi:MAG: Synechococcus phage, partial [Actinomycetota bacterium]
FTSFQEAAQWCQDSKYFYDGVIADRVNLRQWAADIAATHLLIFGERDGKFFLRRALPTTAVTIRGLFTAGNIAEGSFQLQYLDPEDRDPIQVSVRYREERASTDLSNPGLFPVVRELIVREASTPEGATMQSLDMSDYCTNPAHAVDAAKYIIRMRRIPTHSIRFTTTHEGVLAQMAPSDYIRVAMDTTEYDQFNNGVVTPSGALVSTKALADGAYDVIAWNGEAATAPYDTSLTVSANGSQATPTGIVFTVKIPSTQVRTYQIERITPNDDGTFTIEAVHMPTNGSGVLNLAENIELGSTTSSANWTIQG